MGGNECLHLSLTIRPPAAPIIVGTPAASEGAPTAPAPSTRPHDWAGAPEPRLPPSRFLLVPRQQHEQDPILELVLKVLGEQLPVALGVLRHSLEKMFDQFIDLRGVIHAPPRGCDAGEPVRCESGRWCRQRSRWRSG